MPLGEAGAAAGRRCVLRNEYGMPTHRSLPAVIGRLGRCEPPCDEFAGMIEHGRESALGEICPLLVAEFEPRPERRSGKAGEAENKVPHSPKLVVSTAFVSAASSQ